MIISYNENLQDVERAVQVLEGLKGVPDPVRILSHFSFAVFKF